MKSLFYIFFILWGLMSHSQNAIIQQIDNNTYPDNIQAHSDNMLFGMHRNYHMDSVSRVVFFLRPTQGLADLLAKKGISVAYDLTKSTLLALPQKENEDIDLMIDDQLIASNGGSVFQIMGIGLVSASIVLQNWKYKDDVTVEEVDDRRTTVQGLAIGGGALFLIGTTIKTSTLRKMIKKGK